MSEQKKELIKIEVGKTELTIGKHKMELTHEELMDLSFKLDTVLGLSRIQYVYIDRIIVQPIPLYPLYPSYPCGFSQDGNPIGAINLI